MKIFQGEGELKPKELGLSERKPVDPFWGKINPLTTSVPHHTETSQLISRGNSFLKKKKMDDFQCITLLQTTIRKQPLDVFKKVGYNKRYN